MDRDKVKLGSWSALGGAIVLAYGGFNFGGWLTGGAAAAMAKEFAADAVVVNRQFFAEPMRLGLIRE
jgi:hypothetical protein